MNVIIHVDLRAWAVRYVYIRVVNSWRRWGTVDATINFRARPAEKDVGVWVLARRRCGFLRYFSRIDEIGFIVSLKRYFTHCFLALLHMLVCVSLQSFSLRLVVAV